MKKNIHLGVLLMLCLVSMNVASNDDTSDLQAQQLDYALEEWYDLLGPDITFETAMMPITTDDARALIKANEANKDGEPIDSETKARLDEMTQKLESIIQNMRGDGGSTFVKTSSRSAKDASINARARLIELFNTYVNLNNAQNDENGRLISLMQASTDMLRINDAKSAMESFTNSERILQDMNQALDVYAAKGTFNQNILVRRWHNIAVDMEFRGFVKDGRLTALSQYNHMIFSKRLLDNKDEILSLITTFFNEKVKPKIENTKFKDAIVDFALTGKRFADVQAPADHEDKVWVIEINPFLFTTDPGLFDWERDRDLLLRGREDGQVEFRVNRRYSPGIKANLLPEWRELIQVRRWNRDRS